MSRRHAFTLLELLLVVLILAMLAATTSSMVDTAHEQARYDDTSVRLDTIRRAISGPEDMTAPIAGFVADMGRPPATIGELLVGTDSYAVHPTWHVGYGWRGPYLRALTGAAEYPDGWGTPTDPSAPTDFGWDFDENSPQTGDITITSLGSDGMPGPTTTEFTYRADVSATVWRRDHHVNLATDWPTVDLIIRPQASSAGVTLALRVWVPDGTNGVKAIDGAPTTTPPLQGGVDNTVPLPLPTDWIPHGVRAVELCTATMGSPPTLSSIPHPTNAGVNQQFVLITFRARSTYPPQLARTFEIP